MYVMVPGKMGASAILSRNSCSAVNNFKNKMNSVKLSYNGAIQKIDIKIITYVLSCHH
jgi:hypothetical protein